ncbi:MAG: MFS transporter, partial [Chloroflexi bacterium]|nr:MFS transporter [Chloroflexota bacterium]
MDNIHPKKSKVFYGYWIVLVAFLIFFIAGGVGYFAFSLFVRPLEVNLGWSRGEIMGAFTILFLIQGIASPFTGRVVDRY